MAQNIQPNPVQPGMMPVASESRAASLTTGPITSPVAGAAQKPAPPHKAARWVTLTHSLAFVLGFSIVFVITGSAIGLLGYGMKQYMPIVTQLGAVLLVLFALVTMGIFGGLARWMRSKVNIERNPAAAALVSILDWFNQLLYSERRIAEMHKVNRGWGYASSFLLGVTFSAGWIPCIGPILSSIMFLAGDSQTVAQGATLLAVYSLGLGIPFLLTGLFLGKMTPLLRRINKHAGIISIISGIFLFYVAYLLWTDSLAVVTTQFNFLNQFVLGVEDQIVAVTGTGGDVGAVSMWGAFPLALFAGLLSFISPCVLPLVPAYIGLLTGATVRSQSNV